VKPSFDDTDCCNCCNQTLIVQVTVENVICSCFFSETQCSMRISGRE